MEQGYLDSHEHIFEELHRLDLLLNLQIAKRRRDPAMAGFNEFRGLFITEEEVNSILGRAKVVTAADQAGGDDDVQSWASALRKIESRIAARAAAAEGQNTPLRLRKVVELFRLTPGEADALLICLAPELDLKYEKLYAFLQNDVTRKRATVDLVLALTCDSKEEKLEARSWFNVTAPLFNNLLLLFPNDAPPEQTTFLSRFVKLDDRIL